MLPSLRRKSNVNNNNEMMQVLISGLVQAVNLSRVHPWMDHDENFIVAPSSAQVWHCIV